MKYFASALVLMALLTDSTITHALSIEQLELDNDQNMTEEERHSRGCGCKTAKPSRAASCCSSSKGSDTKAKNAKMAAHIDKTITKALDSMDERALKKSEQKRTEEAIKKVEEKAEKAKEAKDLAHEAKAVKKAVKHAQHKEEAAAKAKDSKETIEKFIVNYINF